MRGRALASDEPEEDAPDWCTLVALQPVTDLQDRTVFGYEALARGSLREDARRFVRCSLPAVQYASPALLFVPLTPELLQDEDLDLFQAADEVGAAPGEVAWVISELTALELPQLVERRVAHLRERGFPVAVADVAPGVLSRRPVAELMPNFVILDPVYTSYVSSGIRARAELAGLLAYCARLNAHVILRGIDDDDDAQRLIGLGVRLGIGPHLGSPAVLNASAAEPGDEVVTPAWFRRQGVRVLTAAGKALDTPAMVAKLPTNGKLPVDAQGFAWSLGEAARLMQAEHDPNRILQVTAERLPLTVRADRFAIFEADWDAYRLRARVLAGEELAGLNEMDISMDRGITGWAFLRGYPYNCPDTRSHAEAVSIPGQDETTLEESLLVVPLIAGDHRLGVIDMWRNGRNQFTEEDLERCALFGYITAAAWRNAQLYAELELRAMTDTLTGLLNHRWWDELATREAALSSRAGTQMAILLIDLDHFKQVNDQCGHMAGDALLRNVGRALQGALRNGDAAVRYGGEEFLLMLHNTDEAGAMRVAESVREVMGKLPTPGPGVARVTASIGVAFFPRHGAALDEVVNVADAAMYRAKAEGRNRIVMAPGPALEAPRADRSGAA
ncbi:MAG: diguanylate cyclase [Acidimicrobiales bacterium]|jgi:diguanylate cyclase (GGDEF)-like protein